MSNIKIEGINFLDSLFTQKDFYFLNSLEEEIQLIQEQIQKQENKRDLIVEAINYFESNLKKLNKENIAPISDLLEEIEKVFSLVNSNIKALYHLKEDLSTINSHIVNLLIAIESNPNSAQSYLGLVDDLKENIAEYSNYCTTIKSDIANNDLTINTFLSSDDFKNISKDLVTDASLFSNIPNVNVRKQGNIVNNSSSLSSEKNYINNVLRISEKDNKVYLPYKNNEIHSYLVQFPGDYRSAEDVIKKEFILPLDYYIKHPVLSRFREAYSLIRDREAKSVVEAIKYSMNLMFSYDLNPTIIAACKTQEQLENYLTCLENNELDNFKDFEIKFEISPL